MKICLITQNCIRNFGSDLQAFALCQYIKQLGHEVEILNYWPDKFYENYNSMYLPYDGNLLFNLKRALRNLLFLYHSKDICAARKSYAEFREKYLKLTKNVYKSEKEILDNPPQCDLYIAGSDCIWFPEDVKYEVRFMSIAHKLGKKAIAYAPSLTYNKMPAKPLAEKMKTLLSQVDCLSSREKVGSEIISAITQKKCETVLDPTMLFDEKWWANYFDKTPIVKGDYLLVYALHPTKQIRQLINDAKKHYNMPLILIGSSMSVSYYLNADKVIYSAGPKEFLNLIYNAKKLILSSLHGLAFSILFKKDFVAITGKANDSRIDDILERFSLKERMVHSIDDVKNMPDINYDSIDAKLESERKHSLEYLKNALAVSF